MSWKKERIGKVRRLIKYGNLFLEKIGKVR